MKPAPPDNLNKATNATPRAAAEFLDGIRTMLHSSPNMTVTVDVGSFEKLAPKIANLDHLPLGEQLIQWAQQKGYLVWDILETNTIRLTNISNTPQTLPTWRCVGHHPTEFALFNQSGEQPGILATIRRQKDGSWHWRTPHCCGREPSRETAIDAASANVLPKNQPHHPLTTNH